MRCQDEDLIAVRTVMGKVYKVQRDSVATFKELKAQLQTASGIPTHKQIIIVNTTIVKDDSLPVAPYLPDNPTFLLAQHYDDHPQLQQHYDQPHPQHHNRQNHTGHAHCSHQHNHCIKCGLSEQEHRPSSKEQNRQNPQPNQIPIFDFQSIIASDLNCERFLGQQEQQQYAQFLQNLYSREVVAHLEEMGYGHSTAVKACRASANKDGAWVFADPQTSSQYLNQPMIEMPNNTPRHQQTYLLQYLKTLQTYKQINIICAEDFNLFIASTKQISPKLYQLFLRNKLFIDKVVKICQQRLETQPIRPSLSPSLTSKAGYDSSIKLTPKEHSMMLDDLKSMNVTEEKARLALRMTQNNLPRARQLLLESLPPSQEVDPLQIFSKQLYGLSMLQSLVCSPAWNNLKQKIKNSKIPTIQVYDFIIERLLEHLPVLSIFGKYFWMVALGIVDPRINLGISSIKQSSYLHIFELHSPKDTPVRIKYYENLVDQTLLERFVDLGIDRDEAACLLRAAKNNSMDAIQLVLMGGIPRKQEMYEQFYQRTKNEQKLLFLHIQENNLLLHVANEQDFDLTIASLREINLPLFKIFAKYKGVWEHFSPFIQNKNHNSITKNNQTINHYFLDVPASTSRSAKGNTPSLLFTLTTRKASCSSPHKTDHRSYLYTVIPIPTLQSLLQSLHKISNPLSPSTTPPQVPPHTRTRCTSPV